MTISPIFQQHFQTNTKWNEHRDSQYSHCPDSIHRKHQHIHRYLIQYLLNRDQSMGKQTGILYTPIPSSASDTQRFHSSDTASSLPIFQPLPYSFSGLYSMFSSNLSPFCCIMYRGI